MESSLLNEIVNGLLLYIILVCSVCIHEWGHAFMADKLGDPLPRAQGRVTLNPLAHMDFLGTVIFPLLMIFWPVFSGGTAAFALIGWGKPVMISLPNPKTRRRDDILITLAGPLSNLALCLICALAIPLVAKLDHSAIMLLQLTILLNVALCIFNLIPIPPLDGAHFLKHAIRMREETYYQFSRWGFLILLILINIAPFRKFLGKIIYKVSGIFIDLAQMLL